MFVISANSPKRTGSDSASNSRGALALQRPLSHFRTRRALGPLRVVSKCTRGRSAVAVGRPRPEVVHRFSPDVSARTTARQPTPPRRKSRDAPVRAARVAAAPADAVATSLPAPPVTTIPITRQLPTIKLPSGPFLGHTPRVFPPPPTPRRDRTAFNCRRGCSSQRL